MYNNKYLASLYHKRKRDTLIFQIILRISTKFRCHFHCKCVAQWWYTDKRETDLTMEIITLIDNNMNIQKDNKHHGWRWHLYRNENQMHHREEPIFYSSLEISHSFMGKKDKNGKNILLINENGTKAHPGHSYLVSRWTDYSFCLPNEPRGIAREKVTEIASSCSSIPSQRQPDYTSETFFRIQPLDFPIPKRGKKKKRTSCKFLL